MSSESVVFIGGTYKDIEKYRNRVESMLRRWGYDRIVTMKHWPADDDEALERSIKQLDKCNAYLLIIGPSYGTCSPDSEYSYTEHEFDHALKKRKNDELKISVLIAKGDALLVHRDLTDSDELRRKWDKFVHKIKEHITPESFESEIDLVAKLPGILTKLVDQELFDSVSIEGSIKIFSEDEVPDVFKAADTGVRNKLNAVEDLMTFTAEKFSNLFNLMANNDNLDIHPFFSELRKKIEPIIPGITLDEENAVLKRANVRHVIFRTETAIEILEMLQEEKLTELGKKIGISAATDLVDNVLKKQSLPKNPATLVALWNFWDGTGGWGKFKSVDTDHPEKQDVWRIKIYNSFLTVETSLERTHGLSNFWLGYIEGFLGKALPMVSKIYRKLPPNKMNEITFPPYRVLHTVTRIPDNILEYDVYEVTFQEKPESKAINLLNAARNHITNKGDWDTSGDLVTQALNKIKDAVGFKAYREMVQNISNNSNYLSCERALKEDWPTSWEQKEVEILMHCANKIIDVLIDDEDLSEDNNA